MSKQNKHFDDWSKGDLIREIKKLKKQKKYGVVWEEKSEFVVEQCKEKLPVLKISKEKEIRVDENDPNHILIEGDNYHALSVLNYTHKHKIDVIYIDPPYNTGKSDWKYNNDYVDSNDLWMHSKWLSFMNKRLRLAKTLLKRNGILICSVDDHEHAALGLLLQELFPDKEIVCVSVVHNPAGTQGKNFSYSHEYAYFVYPIGKRCINLQERDEDPDIRPLRNVSKGEHLRETALNCFYPIIIKNKKIVSFGDVCDDSFHPDLPNVKRKDGSIEVYPIDPQGNERKWVFARQSVEQIKDELSVEYNKKRDMWDIIRKKTKFNYKTVWTDRKYNANIYGTQLLNNIIKTTFPFPKSLYNVKECIKATLPSSKNSIILDFFAGSGTTLHAVLELNNEDGGHRQTILCTDNENNICTDVCYPRAKNVITGYIGIKNKKKYPGLGGNLQYFKTIFVEAAPTDRNKKKLVENSTDMLCLKENCFDNIKSSKFFKIFKNSDNQFLGIIFDVDGIESFKKEISKITGKINTYVFSLDEGAREEEFDDVLEKVDLKPIPEVILNVYRRIFR